MSVALRAARLAATLGALVLVVLPGCSERIPTVIEVYAEPGGSHFEGGNLIYDKDTGESQKGGQCSSTASFESHISAKTGSVQVNVTDAAGRTTSIPYTESAADTRTIEGKAGSWTLHVAWQGYVGAIHAGLTC